MSACCVCVFKRLAVAPPICERFKAHPLLKVTCNNCSHDRECHEANARARDGLTFEYRELDQR